MDAGRNRFALSGTLGKLVNISADTSQVDRFAEGPLKSFVAGEEMTFEYKHKDPFTTTPTAKLVLATNVLPHFPDRSNGIWRRLLHLPFNHRVSREERVPEMTAEAFWQPHLDGILRWSLDGLDRLRENNWDFTESDAGAALADEHRRESDPARDFLFSTYVASPDAEPVPFATVYDAYRLWSEANGRKHPVTLPAFNRVLASVFPGVANRAARVKGGKPTKCWFGIRPIEPQSDLLVA
jgi:putative DNA primase/helicase